MYVIVCACAYGRDDLRFSTTCASARPAYKCCTVTHYPSNSVGLSFLTLRRLAAPGRLPYSNPRRGFRKPCADRGLGQRHHHAIGHNIVVTNEEGVPRPPGPLDHQAPPLAPTTSCPLSCYVLPPPTDPDAHDPTPNTPSILQILL